MNDMEYKNMRFSVEDKCRIADDILVELSSLNLIGAIYVGGGECAIEYNSEIQEIFDSIYDILDLNTDIMSISEEICFFLEKTHNISIEINDIYLIITK